MRIKFPRVSRFFTLLMIFIISNLAFEQLLKYWFPSTGLGRIISSIIHLLIAIIISLCIFHISKKVRSIGKTLLIGIGLMISFLFNIYTWPSDLGQNPPKIIYDAIYLYYRYDKIDFQDLFQKNKVKAIIAKYKFSHFLNEIEVFHVQYLSDKRGNLKKYYLILEKNGKLSSFQNESIFLNKKNDEGSYQLIDSTYINSIIFSFQPFQNLRNPQKYSSNEVEKISVYITNIVFKEDNGFYKNYYNYLSKTLVSIPAEKGREIYNSKVRNLN